MYTPAWFSTMQEIILQIYIGNLIEIKVTQKENLVRIITCDVFRILKLGSC